MGVEVDEPGGNHEPVGVDDPSRRLVDRAEGDDAPVTHADVGRDRGRARSVDDPPAAHEEIEHQASCCWTTDFTEVPAKKSGFWRV